MAKTKAYLTKGIEIRWKCNELLTQEHNVEENEIFRFPNGISDYLNDLTRDKSILTSEPFSGKIEFEQNTIEWIINWLEPGEYGFIKSHCNTVSTPLGGTHEHGFRNAILKGYKNWGELSGNKKAQELTIDDIFTETVFIVSIF